MNKSILKQALPSPISPRSMEHILIHHNKRSYHASGGSVNLNKLKKYGRFGDTEIAYVPSHLADQFDEMMGATSRNPHTGNREYFLGPLSMIALPAIVAGATTEGSSTDKFLGALSAMNPFDFLLHPKPVRPPNDPWFGMDEYRGMTPQEIQVAMKQKAAEREAASRADPNSDYTQATYANLIKDQWQPISKAFKNNEIDEDTFKNYAYQVGLNPDAAFIQRRIATKRQRDIMQDPNYQKTASKLLSFMHVKPSNTSAQPPNLAPAPKMEQSSPPTPEAQQASQMGTYLNTPLPGPNNIPNEDYLTYPQQYDSY